MKKSIGIMVLVMAGLLFLSVFSYADTFKVRITVEKANVRLKPTKDSTIIKTLPFGVILEAEKKIGDWYYIKLHQNDMGIVVTGYIHQTIVEEIKEENKPKTPVKPKKIQNDIPELIKKPTESITYLVKDPKYLKWKKDYFRAETSFLKWRKFSAIGIGVTILGPIIASLIIATGDDAYVTGGIVGGAVSLVGAGLWIYSGVNKSLAFTKMHLLMNRGWIKGYLGIHVNPQKKSTGLTLSLMF